ncbi:EscU/YscU/HrcU family type III secretion system export apparatus switch protein [Bdellovibrio sp. SKB1291214]|uniref:EscU/YscU/HrcU family type III secretion system export apparatus switch protein n=1 Tax=Bdellovibrio sp. SKB1291214 TaxID=1732569 RepID=UPI00223F8296|nr:EscU/YscU/HrcU family type III secretion system export apparatus switch protein [Bdellovibrio sp. SKB1291214]UYL09189.1 EscU/YscU/HrcU family type III secretion system export apparatus switch protein [Bdellovibrio sp. SKB1291214]
MAQSKELATAVLLLAASGGIYALGRFFFKNFYDLFHYSLGPDMVAMIRTGNFTEALRMNGEKALILIAPVMGIAGLLGAAATVAQIGFLQVEDALTPDPNKLNPVEGMKRVMSLRAVMEAVKGILKMCAIGMVLYFLLRGEVHQIPYLMSFSIEQICSYIGNIVSKLLGGVGGVMLVLAAADYFYQRWDLEKKMMMTKQEVKEEHKQREGDPMIKSRIRRIQREMASKRMMSEVPKADVVITNPTHIAVVLKYSDNLPAPQVVAMGADVVAENIKALAREHNIPIVENKPLARTIFKTMKIGQVIPRDLFVAVAEVLSYVYRLRRKKR